MRCHGERKTSQIMGPSTWTGQALAPMQLSIKCKIVPIKCHMCAYLPSNKKLILSLKIASVMSASLLCVRDHPSCIFSHGLQLNTVQWTATIQLKCSINAMQCNVLHELQFHTLQSIFIAMGSDWALLLLNLRKELKVIQSQWWLMPCLCKSPKK